MNRALAERYGWTGGNLKYRAAPTTPASRPREFDTYRQSQYSWYESDDARSYSLQIYLIQGIFSTQSIWLSAHKQMYFGNHKLIPLITSRKFKVTDKHRFSLPVFSWYQNTTTATVHMLSNKLITLCLLDHASSWELKNKRPTWCHLLFYFTSYVLNMFRTLTFWRWNYFLNFSTPSI